jgi:hypothetical protein
MFQRKVVTDIQVGAAVGAYTAAFGEHLVLDLLGYVGAFLGTLSGHNWPSSLL